jgi:dipeptidyl aminopeptidase/acylaminoacyl peptidase
MPILLSKTSISKPDVTSILLEKAKDKNFFLEMWGRLNFFKIRYQSGENKVNGFLILPKNTKKLPCIIYNRGGSKDYGNIDDRLLFMRLAKYADAGFVIIASQYSGNDGSEGKDEFGGKDLDDVLNLKLVIDELDEADSTNIGMLGGSRGGMMTYLSLAKVDWIKTAIIEAGVTNVFRSYELRPNLLEFRSDMYNVNSREENIKRSVLFWPETICTTTSILIYHGTKDLHVCPLDSIQLSEKLIELKHPFELRLLMNDDHHFSINRKNVISESISWFTKYLV